MSMGSLEIQFAQRLASNEKTHRDRAVRKLKKWLAARSECRINVMSKEELMVLWKGLFYCMWMSDKSLIQEELAQTLSDLIHSFSTVDSALLFIDCFFETMEREWSGIDYLRIDKFMMLVRTFLASSFKFLKASKWDSSVVDRFLEVLCNTAVAPDKPETVVGLQLHVADIYIEELAKVATDEVSGKDLTKFFVPYCKLLVKSINVSLKKTVIERIFKFSMRLSDDDSDEDDGESGPANGEGNEVENEIASDGDDNSSISSIDDEKVMYKGEREWRHRVRKHELETDKLPFPQFDYQDIGDMLLEIAGKTRSLNLKQRSEIYEVVKLFHEMAKGIFPLDTVAHSQGSKLRSKDVEAAAKRLLEEDEENEMETVEWNESLRRLRKRRRLNADEDLEDSSSEGETDDESDDEDKNSVKDESSKKLNVLSKDLEKKDEDNGVVVDKLLQRLLAKRQQTLENKKAKKKNKKSPKFIAGDVNHLTAQNENVDKSENNSLESSNGIVSCNNAKDENSLVKNCQLGQEDKQNQQDVSVAQNSCEVISKSKKRKRRDSLKRAQKKIDRRDETGESEVKRDESSSTLTEEASSMFKSDICEISSVPSDHDEKSPNHDLAGKKSTVNREASESCHVLNKINEVNIGNIVSKSSDEVATSTADNEIEVVSNAETENKPDANKQTSPNSSSLSDSNEVKRNRKLTNKTKLKTPTKADPSESSLNTPILNSTTRSLTKNGNESLKSKAGSVTKSKAKAENHKGGSRYFDMKMQFDDTNLLNTEKKVEKKISVSNQNDEFVKFVDFVKKPPVFFRTAVSKVSPKAKKRTINSSTPNQNFTTPGFSKKVSFELQKNGAQGVKDYFNSVKNSPGLPFKADSFPTKCVLKVKAGTQKSTPAKHFISLKVNPTKRAVAKDFFQFE